MNDGEEAGSNLCAIGIVVGVVGVLGLIGSAYTLAVCHQSLDAVHIGHGRGSLLWITTNRDQLRLAILLTAGGAAACAVYAAAYFGWLRRLAGPEAAPRTVSRTAAGPWTWRRCGAAVGRVVRPLAQRWRSRRGQHAGSDQS